MSGWVVETEHPTRRFRPDLEGLRAVAVVLVLLYHAKIPGFTGGYVGVDVFFVLSGFLITGLLYRELRSSHGQIALASFYARRARRLLPAAAFVLLSTLVVALFLLPQFRLGAVTTDVAAAALYVSNFRFALDANDYFQATGTVSPVLHFWSLSVEEQFYIFWPAVLLFAHNWLPDIGTPRVRVGAAIAVLGAVSLIGGIFLTGVNAPWAFFLLPTRGWELAIGGLLAVFARDLVTLPRRLAGGATAAGLALVLSAALLFDDSTPFPGFAAMLPVVGAALVILGGFAQPATLPSQLLSLSPMRFLGRISYSLYLWHWPILTFGALIVGAAWSPLLALVAIPVAAASQRWVEEPLRAGRFIGALPSRNLLQAAGAGVVIVAAAFAISPPRLGNPTSAVNGVAAPQMPGPPGTSAETGPRGSGAPPSPAPGLVASLPPSNPPEPCLDCSVSDLTPPLDDSRAGRIGGCVDLDVPDLSKCVLGYAVGARAVVAVFGDSHAQSWGSALERLALIHGWRVVNLTNGGCPSVATAIWAWDLKRERTECELWREAAFARLAAEQPTIIVISNASGYTLMSGADRIELAGRPGQWGALWSQGLQATLARLTPLQGTLVVLGDVPHLVIEGSDPLACIARHTADFQVCQAPRTTVVPTGVHQLERADATKVGAVFVDPTSWLCDPRSCPAVIARYVVYLDATGHLTAPFADSLAGRLFAAVPFPK